MVTNDAGCCQKCENDVATSDLLAATSSGHATWSQKLNMFSENMMSIIDNIEEYKSQCIFDNFQKFAKNRIFVNFEHFLP